MSAQETIDLRALPSDELDHELDESLRALFNLRFQAATRQLADVSQVRSARRRVARVRTLLRERDILTAIAEAGDEDALAADEPADDDVTAEETTDEAAPDDAAADERQTTTRRQTTLRPTRRQRRRTTTLRPTRRQTRRRTTTLRPTRRQTRRRTTTLRTGSGSKPWSRPNRQSNAR